MRCWKGAQLPPSFPSSYFSLSDSKPKLPPQDLSYEVWNSANKKERIKLLTSVSGFMPPGHLSALVRPLLFGLTCPAADCGSNCSWNALAV